MKSKERPWVLTKEIPTYEVNKDHEGLKAQKEEKKEERKSKKEEVQTCAMSGIPILQEVDPLKESLRDLEKDVDGLGDPKKDMSDPKDRTNHLQVSLKEEKIR